MKKNIGCFLVILVLLLLLCAAGGGWLSWRASQTAPQSFVQIREPESGILTDLNETLPLAVYAEASRPILRLEVYADGALIAAANGERNTLTLAQPWAASTPGRHVLLARAFFSAEDFADSQAVFVDTADLSGLPVQVNVDDLPRGEGVTEVRLGDLAAASGTTPEEIARLNPGLPASPEALIPPGTPLSLPRRSNPPPASRPAIPPPAPGAPGTPVEPDATPHFDGETHSCSQVSLRWTSTEFESGYRIYRLAPGEDLMTLLADVPVGANTYTDSPVTRVGTYRYFLAAIWPRGGEGITSMLNIEIGPECSPAGTSGTASLNLLMLQLTAQEAYNGVYCYVSVNGSRYERLPGDPGLLRPTSGDLGYDLPLQLPSRGLYAITVPTDGLVRLEGECWGRRGAESVRIGRFSGSHASPEWDGRDLTTELLAFEPRQLASLTGEPAPAGGASFLRYRIQPAASRFDLSNIAPGALQSIYLNIPPILDPLEGNDTTIPAPTNLRIQNVAGCDVFPTTDPNVESSVCNGPLTPLLRWDWRGNSFYNEPDVTAWRINVTIIDDLRPGSAPIAGPSLLVVRPLGAASAGRSAGLPTLPSNYACGVTAQITVTTLTARGNSLPSQPLVLRQPPCPNLGLVRITINAITVGPSASSGEVRDDGDICILCADRRLEVFGDIVIGINNYAPAFSNDPSYGAGTILFGDCPNSTACLTEGRYQWGSRPHIAPWLSEMEAQAQTLGSQGEITFVALLSDYDTQNSPDHYCVASGSLAPRNKFDWTRINETVILTGGSGEASCQVEILVQGIPSFSAP